MALPPYTPDADNALQPVDTVVGGYAAREIRAVKVKLTTTKGIADDALADAAAAQGTANTALSTANTANGKADNNAACLGVSGDPDLGTFTGSIIPDDSTVKTALQVLETYLDAGGTPDAAARARIDNLAAIIGRAYSDTDMGTFTGTLLPDSGTVKSLLQVLETRAEQSQRIYNCTLNGTTGTPSGGPDGFTFADMNDLLAACADDSIINVEVVDYLCTWNATPVTRRRCEINININYYGDATERGIKITATGGAAICTLIDCDVTIRGESEEYSLLRLISGVSNLNINGIDADSSIVRLETLTVQFANSAAHALGCGFILFNQDVGNARIAQVTAEWDPVFTPVPNTNGIYVIKAGTTGESWADHDLDISYFELAAATATYYKGATNRKYISDVFNSASPAPHTLAANSKLTFDLATSGRVMQRITSGMLILTCTSTDQGYAVGEILYLAIGAPGSSVASDMGAFISADLAGTQQIATITLTIGQGGLSYVRDTAAYTVVALNLAKWDAQLYCRDES